MSGTATPTGSPLISGPMVTQIQSTVLALDIPSDLDATSAINPSGVVSTTATLHLDLSATAADILANRVKPAIVAAGYPQLVANSWVVLDLDNATITLPLPAGTAATGTPSASAGSVGASAAFGPSGITVTLGHVSVDTRTPVPPLDITVSWQVADAGQPAPRTIDLHPGSMSFTNSVTVGVLFFGSPVTGGATGPWSCVPVAPNTVLTTTDVVTQPVSTTTSTSSSTTSSSTTSPPTSTTTTTWPSTIQTPPGSCAVSGFDRFDGYSAISLDATGYFHTQQVNGQWWLVTPDGHPFWSAGINHMSFAGTPDRNGVTLYQDSVTAKYGTQQAWADAQLVRMNDWGYNTIGAWSDLDTLTGHEPYTLLLGLTSEDFGSGQMVDLWSTAWTNGVDSTIAAAAAQHANDPYLVGYWLDNELHWGPDWRPLHLFDEYLARTSTEPGKQVMITWLQQRYPTFADFAADFTTTATDWTTLSDPSTVTAWTSTGGEATRAAWVGAVAERYFSYTNGVLRAADPNHLNLGPRMIAHTASRPLLEAAARYVDVASFNLYPILPELIGPLLNADPTYLPVDGPLAAQAQILGKPMLISEWSYRAADSGLPNTWPPLFPTLQTQAQRAAAYEAYVKALLSTNYVVGQHWFELTDEPAAGRFDNEDSNFGLVDGYDNPYPLLTSISKTMHDCAYARLVTSATADSTTTTTMPAVDATAAEPVTARPAFTG